MPFKSKSQQKWMYANEPEMAERWSDHTLDHKSLPDKVKKNKRKKKAADALATAWEAIKAPVAAASDAITSQEDVRRKEEDKLQRAVDRHTRERMARRIAAARVPKMGAYDPPSPPSNRHYEMKETVHKALRKHAMAKKICDLFSDSDPKPHPKGVKVVKSTVKMTPLATVKVKGKREKKAYLELRFCRPQRLKLACVLFEKTVEKLEKQADTARVQGLMSQGLSSQAAIRQAYPDWDDNQVANESAKFPGLNKQADKKQKPEDELGSMQQAYVADAVGADSHAKALKQVSEHEDVDEGLINALIASGAASGEPIQRRIRHGASYFAESPKARMVGRLDPTQLLTENPDQTLTGLIAGTGKRDEEREELVKERYRKVLKKYQDKLDPDAELTERDTPWHRQQQGLLADSDSDIAGHKYMRDEKPWQYWLNPVDKSGPLTELLDRGKRRLGAGMAYPDSTLGRFGMGVGTAGTLGLLPLIAGGEKAQQSLRRSAAENEIYSDAATPEKA